MALLSTAIPKKTGTVFAPIAATATGGGGDTFLNSGREFFYIKNAGSSMDVTFVAQGTCDFLTTDHAHDLVVTVAGSTEKIIGPFSQTRFNDANSHVTVHYSSVTSVTVGVLAAASNA
jgi:hypothetical protein